MHQSRKLVAIMFTDIEGYTALMQESEATAVNVRNRHREIYDKATEKYQGRTIQYFGDGTLSIFDSAVHAVECAIEMQKGFRSKPAIPVRIGIHTGDIIITDKDIIGDAVNLASRVESLGVSGSVLVSSKVNEELRSQQQIKTRSLGLVHFKNDANPREVFAILDSSLVVPKPYHLKGKTIKIKDKNSSFWERGGLSKVFKFLGMPQKEEQPSNRSIAVLPVNDLSGKTGNEQFLSGIHHGLINELGKISGLRVISRTSTLSYQMSTKSIPQIARELEVDIIVEVTLLEFIEKINIDISVIKALPKEKKIWSHTFSRYVGDIFNLYQNVSKEISKEIRIPIKPKEEILLTQYTPVDPKAYKEYLKGLFYWEMLTPESLNKSLDHYEEAIKLDPKFTKAHAGKAFVWGGKMQMALAPPAEAIPKIYDGLNVVREFDGYDSETFAFIGAMAFWAEWNWEKGKEMHEKAIELNPNNANAIAYYAHILMILQKRDRALEEISRALKIDPFNPLIAALASIVYVHTGQFDLAIEWAQKSLLVIPDHRVALISLVIASYCKGDIPETISVIKELMKFNNIESKAIEDLSVDKFPTTVHSLAKDLAEISQSQLVDPLLLASIFYFGEDYAKTLDWLENAIKSHSPNAPYIFISNPFKISLGDHPRLKELADEIGLPIKPLEEETEPLS